MSLVRGVNNCSKFLKPNPPPRKFSFYPFFAVFGFWCFCFWSPFFAALPPPFLPVGLLRTVPDRRAKFSKLGSRANYSEELWFSVFLWILASGLPRQGLDRWPLNFTLFVRGMVLVKSGSRANHSECDFMIPGVLSFHISGSHFNEWTHLHLVNPYCLSMKLLQQSRGPSTLHIKIKQPPPQTNKTNNNMSQRNQEYPKRGWSSLPWASPTGLEVPVPFISISHSIPLQKNKKNKSMSQWNQEYPKRGWSSLPWASPTGLEVPVTFISISHSIPLQKNKQEKQKYVTMKSRVPKKGLKFLAVSFSYKSRSPNTFYFKIRHISFKYLFLFAPTKTLFYKYINICIYVYKKPIVLTKSAVNSSTYHHFCLWALATLVALFCKDLPHCIQHWFVGIPLACELWIALCFPPKGTLEGSVSTSPEPNNY